MAVSNNSVGLMLPILFLLIAELATAGREIDLLQAHKEQREPLGFPKLKDVFPPLGRFNFIHGANMSILIAGLGVVTVLSEGWIYWIGILLSWVLFVSLPALEVDEYNKILGMDDISNRIPIKGFYSFHAHFVMATLITGFFVGYKHYIMGEAILEGQDLLILFVMGVVLLGGGCYLIFTWTLDSELEDVWKAEMRNLADSTLSSLST